MPNVTVGACISLTGPLAHPSNLPVGGGNPPPDQLNYASRLTNYLHHDRERANVRHAERIPENIDGFWISTKCIQIQIVFLDSE